MEGALLLYLGLGGCVCVCGGGWGVSPCSQSISREDVWQEAEVKEREASPAAGHLVAVGRKYFTLPAGGNYVTL